MCYHYSLDKKPEEIEKKYGARFVQSDLFSPVYHTSGFNYLQMPVITSSEPEQIQLFSWGLIPFWQKDYKKAMEARNYCLNAKSETAFDLPSFRSPIKSKRCLIPVTGFFEWMDFKGKKYPHYIHLKKEEIFSFGGIWDSCKLTDQEGREQKIYSFSILTTEANPLMAKIHNSKKRMPLILPKEKEKIWINEDLLPEEIKNLMMPFPEEEMEAYTVSKLITSRKENPNVPIVNKHQEYPELTNV